MTMFHTKIGMGTPNKKMPRRVEIRLGAIPHPGRSSVNMLGHAHQPQKMLDKNVLVPITAVQRRYAHLPEAPLIFGNQ